LQDRLPKELALSGITTIGAANRWLAETYWPAHNAAFAVASAEAGSAFVPDRTGRVREILCLQEQRRLGNDNTVKWRGPLCSPRRARCGRIWCVPPCACTSTPTAGWLSSMGRIGWPITTPRETRAMTLNWLREPLRPNHHRSGQFMRYEYRST
jgi:hypothetical protein